MPPILLEQDDAPSLAALPASPPQNPIESAAPAVQPDRNRAAEGGLFPGSDSPAVQSPALPWLLPEEPPVVQPPQEPPPQVEQRTSAIPAWQGLDASQQPPAPPILMMTLPVDAPFEQMRIIQEPASPEDHVHLSVTKPAPATDLPPAAGPSPQSTAGTKPVSSGTDQPHARGRAPQLFQATPGCELASSAALARAGLTPEGQRDQAGLPKQLPCLLPEGPGQVSSIAFMPRQDMKPRKFWFKVNAELVIYGATERDAAVTLDGQPVALRPDGTFTCRFALPDGAYSLLAHATSADRCEQRRAELAFSRATSCQKSPAATESDPGLRLLRQKP